MYFGTKGGTLYRASKTGASVQAIAQAGYIFGIAVHDGYVYFGSINDHSVYRIPVDLSTGVSVVTADPSPQFGGLAGVIGADVYYSIVSGFRRVPISGGTPVDVVTNWNNGSFATDASSIFFSDARESPYKVHRFDTATNTLSIVNPDAGVNLGFNRNGSNVFVDANNVYVGTPTIYQTPKQGGTVIPLVTRGTIAPQGGGGAFGYASDGTFVYYAEGPHDGTYTDILKAVPVGGGTPTTLASGVSIHHMVYDNSTLYWDVVAEGPGQDAIYRLDISPLSPPLPVLSQIQNPLTTIPPAQPPTPNGPSRNLVLLVHGWNSDPSAWATALATRIRAQIDSARADKADWDVATVNWSDLADLHATLLQPNNAYANATRVVDYIWPSLRDKYKFVHLVAHSAGSKVIDDLALRFIFNSTRGRPTVHETFLDAYSPAGNQERYGCLADWAESYVDMRLPVSTTGVFVRDFLNTNLTLRGALNIEVQTLDPIPSTANGNIVDDTIRVHAWPYWWYLHTAGVDPAGSPAAGLDSADSWIYGYGLSREFGRGALSTPTLAPPPIDSLTGLPIHTTGFAKGERLCLAGSHASLVCGPVTTGPAALPVSGIKCSPSRRIVSNAWTSPARTVTKSTTGTVILYAGPELADLHNASPVWVTFSALLPELINTVSFDYKFTSGTGSNGLLSAYVDDHLVFSREQAFAGNGVVSTDLLPTGDLPPGVHTLAFRLDMLSPVPSSVRLSNLVTGVAALKQVSNVPPTALISAPAVVRLSSLVSLDGRTSFDNDAEPTPLSFFWSQASGATGMLSDANFNVAKFVPTSPGRYLLQLIVRDGTSPSLPVTVTVKAPVLGDVDLDGDVDRVDVATITAGRNTLADGPNDIRDLNGDGKIDVADSRKAAILCTRAQCATQ